MSTAYLRRQSTADAGAALRIPEQRSSIIMCGFTFSA
jgi:hypothetical protein